jgi:hypothetical protein
VGEANTRKSLSLSCRVFTAICESFHYILAKRNQKGMSQTFESWLLKRVHVVKLESRSKVEKKKCLESQGKEKGIVKHPAKQ